MPTPDHPRPALGTASEAILAVSRMLSAAIEGEGAAAVQEALVREARTFLAASGALLVSVSPADRVAVVVAGDAAPSLLGRAVTLDDHAALAEVVDRRLRLLCVKADQSGAPLGLLLPGLPVGSLLLLPLRSGGSANHVLVLARRSAGDLDPEKVEIATAFATAAGASLGQLRLAEEHERKAAQQSALTRAAKTLTESLDLETLLARICQEAATILDADVAAVYRGGAVEGLTIEATYGFPPEVVGHKLDAGQGLSGKAAQTGRPMLTNDYQRIAGTRPDSAFARVRACLAVPMRWEGELRGVLSVGYRRPHRVGDAELTLLETFAELAAVAFRNASAHAGLALAARTDGLTGCLNHAALHEGLRREIERADRAGRPLSLVLLDLDDFKQVNEMHGHLVGDEVLRRAGHAVRHATRPYDLAARYGGDEFALVTVEADEADACEIALRAIERLSAALGDLDDGRRTRATAGVAEWSQDITATEVIARADRALLFGKQEGARGSAVAFSTLPEAFRPARFSRQERGLPEPPPMPAPSAWPRDRRREVDDRLRKRTRQLALANALGARLAAMTEPQAIMDAAVEELHRAFGYFLCAIIRLRPDGKVECAAGRGAAFQRLVEQDWAQPRDDGLIGRCLRERRPVLSNDVRAEPDYAPTSETHDVASELVVPVWVAGELWGAINLEEVRPGAFHDDDLRLVETLADQVGAALRSAMLFEQLERAYLGTAEALAAALEAKDADTADHARSIVEHAEAVGRRLGMDDADLRDLRFASVFHDIGKIAVPEAILHKPGPLTPEERAVIERHTIVGEQILAPVDFLAGVRRLVRHEHERWDGAGYPDGLRGEEIPLGARIILACDALHAMTSDRPYRRAMPAQDAHAELRRNAGTHFDPRVVDALLAVVEADSGVAESAVRP